MCFYLYLYNMYTNRRNVEKNIEGTQRGRIYLIPYPVALISIWSYCIIISFIRCELNQIKHEHIHTQRTNGLSK